MAEVVRTRDAASFGIKNSTLRGPGWQPVSHGLHRRAGPVRLLETCRALLQVLPPGTAFAHLTAATIYGLWVPRAPRDFPVLACLPPGEDRPERSGLYVFRSRAGQLSHRQVQGVPVLAPELVLGQLAEDLCPLDLAVAIDSALRSGHCTLMDIERAIVRRQRGLPVLRLGISLADGRSESPWETRLRLIHRAAGFQVEPQYVVSDDTGAIIARADLRLSGTRRLPEYDGAPHRSREQHERDLEREKLLARLGFERYGYIARELVHTPERIIADAEEALGLDRDRARLAAWQELVGPSVLTRSGKRRLLHRLHRFSRPLRGRKHA